METFKDDRHALRWPKMRESKLASFIRYTFQPGVAVFSFIGSTVAIIAALVGSLSVVGIYIASMMTIIGVNYLKWVLYQNFKGKP